jgi:hypothetical protein
VPAVIAIAIFMVASATVLQARLRPSIEDSWWQQLRYRWHHRADDVPSLAEGGLNVD